MPLTRTAMLSRLLVLVALGASLSEAMLSCMGLGFSGLPDGLVARAAYILGGVFWIPTAASWKFPRAGFGAFAVLFATTVVLCEPPISPPPGWADCIIFILPGAFNGAFLGLNLLLVLVERHRSRAALP